MCALKLARALSRRRGWASSTSGPGGVVAPRGVGGLDVEAGQRARLAAVVSRLHDPGVHAEARALRLAEDVHLVDVEAELVEGLQPLLHAPQLVAPERADLGERIPEGAVA